MFVLPNMFVKYNNGTVIAYLNINCIINIMLNVFIHLTVKNYKVFPSINISIEP
jgi:hypothetical protein